MTPKFPEKDLPLTEYLCRTPNIFICISLSLTHLLWLSLLLSFYLPIYFSLSLNYYGSHCFSLSLSIYLNISLSLNLSTCLWTSVCVFPKNVLKNISCSLTSKSWEMIMHSYYVQILFLPRAAQFKRRMYMHGVKCVESWNLSAAFSKRVGAS